MDYYSSEQLYKYFESEIKKNATKQMNDLKKEIADLKEKEINKVQSELKDSIDAALKLDLKELETDHSYEINRITQDNSRQLMKRRQELLENVFLAAQGKLVKFTASKKYEKLMKQKIEAIADRFSNSITVFKIRKGDTALKENLKDNYKHKFTTEEDPEIIIGGFSAFFEQLSIEIDETIDYRLKDQKEWFYANSNLFVK